MMMPSVASFSHIKKLRVTSRTPKRTEATPELHFNTIVNTSYKEIILLKTYRLLLLTFHPYPTWACGTWAA